MVYYKRVELKINECHSTLCNNSHSCAEVTRSSAGHHNHVDLNAFKIDVYLSACFWGRGTEPQLGDILM